VYISVFALQNIILFGTFSVRLNTKIMKKTSLKKLLKAIFAPIGKAIFIFAIFGLAVYAYAEVTWPGTEPAPVSGVVGMYIGLSDDTSDGDASGYEAANEDFCETVYNGSHICTGDEMINTLNNNPGAFGSDTGQVWVNNGPPGHDETLANDCQGWTEDDASVSGYGRYGAIWNIDSKKAALQFCDAELYFACCK